MTVHILRRTVLSYLAVTGMIGGYFGSREAMQRARFTNDIQYQHEPESRKRWRVVSKGIEGAIAGAIAGPITVPRFIKDAVF